MEFGNWIRAPTAPLSRRFGKENFSSSVPGSSSSSQENIDPLKNVLANQSIRSSENQVLNTEQRDLSFSAIPKLLNSVSMIDAPHSPQELNKQKFGLNIVAEELSNDILSKSSLVILVSVSDPIPPVVCHNLPCKEIDVPITAYKKWKRLARGSLISSESVDVAIPVSGDKRREQLFENQVKWQKKQKLSSLSEVNLVSTTAVAVMQPRRSP